MFNQKINRVRKTFTQYNIDSLLVSNFYNILYLTGFKTLTTDEREAFVLVTKSNIYLFTDARYPNNFKFEILNFKLKLLEPGKGLFFYLQEIFKEENIQALGIEAEDLRVHEYLKLKLIFSNVKIICTEKLIIQLRAIKEKEEIEKITKACQITDQCLKEIIKTIKIGDTEKEVAFRIEKWLNDKGYDCAFDPIVAINKNSSIPHYHTKDGLGRIKNKSVVLIDFGAEYQNYCSDITRMIFIEQPGSEIINIYNQLLNIQEKVIKEINNQKNPKNIDFFCRNQIGKKQLPNYSHSTGHGVGLEIHEYPKISQNSIDVLQDDQVFTIEPGVYFKNKWGIRIEDTVVIQNNKAEILTRFKKEPILIKFK